MSVGIGTEDDKRSLDWENDKQESVEKDGGAKAVIVIRVTENTRRPWTGHGSLLRTIIEGTVEGKDNAKSRPRLE